MHTTPTSESYRTLDGRYHYFAVVGVEPYEQHYVATFHDYEAAECLLTASPEHGARLQGCGFPATLAPVDTVPTAGLPFVPALRALVLREYAGASAVHLTYQGTYRRVLLEEEAPCDGKHGHGYSTAELRYDAALSDLQSVHFASGSSCGAADFYWASPSPKWLALRTETALLHAGITQLPPALRASLQDVLASPETDHGMPPTGAAEPQ